VTPSWAGGAAERGLGAKTLRLFSRRRRRLAARRGVRVAAALAAAWLTAACGIQGPVEPPRLQYPQPIKDLAVTQEGRIWELSFTVPQLATDGERLTKPLEIEISRTVTPRGSQPPAQPADLAPWVSLSPSQVAARRRDNKLHYAAQLSEAEFGKELGSTFSFATRGLTRRFHGRVLAGEWSKEVSAVLLDVSGFVEHLRVRPTEKALEVSWAAPSRSLSGGPLPPLAGYRLFRSETGKAGSFQLRAEATGTAFSDSEFRFGGHYYYKVRAVFKQGGTTAESGDSPEVEITPRDIFPPAAPGNISAIYAAGAVEVIWTANTEPDLAGYNVYRRAPSGPFQKVNSKILPTPIFRDPSVQPGHTYEYRVTALDLAGNESLPSAEVRVEAR
jgi:hypothetical protein